MKTINSPPGLRISGTGAPLLVQSLAIAALALFMPMYLEAQGASLPAENVTRIRHIAASVVLVLGLGWLFCSTQSIEFKNEELVYTSWLTKN